MLRRVTHPKPSGLRLLRRQLQEKQVGAENLSPTLWLTYESYSYRISELEGPIHEFQEVSRRRQDLDGPRTRTIQPGTG